MHGFDFGGMVGSSVNPYYTFKYSQPNEYHFSHDSVFLARRVFEILKFENLVSKKVLDLCSGCGIVGLDFLFHLRKENKSLPYQIDFLEVQDVYFSHFKQNCISFGEPPTKITYLDKNYETLLSEEHPQQYDLILCNPPYFDSHQGTLSPSIFKNRCRFFLDSSYRSLIDAIAQSLSSQGRAYVLSRRDIPETQGLEVQIVEKIRGTPLYLLTSLR